MTQAESLPGTRPKIGVVGSGYWGPNLIRNIAALPGCELTAICDAQAERLAPYESQYPNVTLTTDHRDLLERIAVDAGLTATPAATHVELATQFLQAGRDVFVEKPLALTSDDAKALIALAEREARVLMVGHTFEFSPAVRKIQ